MTGNLPAALDRLVGRDAELAALARLRARLVTLHGPGGAGKTRLATEFATRAGERFPGGAWLVELRRPDFRPTADLVVDVEIEPWSLGT